MFNGYKKKKVYTVCQVKSVKNLLRQKLDACENEMIFRPLNNFKVPGEVHCLLANKKLNS